MNSDRLIPGTPAKPAEDKVERKPAPTGTKETAEPATPASNLGDKPAGPQNTTTPAAGEAAKKSTPPEPAAAPAQAPPALRGLDWIFYGEPVATPAQAVPTPAKVEPAPASDKRVPAKPADSKPAEAKPPETKTADVPPSPAKPAQRDEPEPSFFRRIFRGPTIGVQSKPEPAKSSSPTDARASSAATPASSAAASKDIAKKFPDPEKKPEPPPAPKAATWKSLPAKDDWCPPEIARHFPELARHTQHDCAAFDRVLASGWRIVGATRRGRDHANKGTHREDALAFVAQGPFTVLCVSDGAGSCKFSRIGSHVAVRTVTDSLRAALENVEPSVAGDREKLLPLLKSKLTAAVVAACAELGELAAKSACNPKDFRCTLLTALHWRGEKHEFWLVSQVGDGAVLVLRKDKSTQRLGTPDSGQHSGEVSCFVPDPDARKKAEVIDVVSAADDVECVLLCSDGIEDPFYPIATKAAELFKQFHSGVEKPLADFKSQPAQPALFAQESAAWTLAQWLEFEKRGEFDDRTALLMHRHPGRMTQ